MAAAAEISDTFFLFLSEMTERMNFTIKRTKTALKAFSLRNTGLFSLLPTDFGGSLVKQRCASRLATG